MSSHRIVSFEIVLYDEAATSTFGNDRLGADPRNLWNFAENLCAKGRAGGGQSAMGIVMRSLGVNNPAPTFTVACVRASWTAGDKLRIVTPDGVWHDLVAAVTPNYQAGQYGQGASTNTHLGDEIVKAVMQYLPLRRWFTAVNASGTVTLTGTYDAKLTSTVSKIVTTAGVFTIASGVSALKAMDDTAAMTVTLGGQPSANDTLVIGPVTFTWKASGASGENQINIGANTTASALALKNAIVAHTVLKNFVTSTSSTNVCTITVLYASAYTAGWTISKTGTYTPTLAGSLFPTTATLLGADQARAYNIR